MQFDHGTVSTQSRAQAVEQLPMPTWEDFFCDQMFTNYAGQDVFSDPPSENASATAANGVAGSSQVGGNINELHHTTPQATDPHPQEQGYFPTPGEFGESAEQQVPQIPVMYPQQQDVHLPPIPTDIGNNSFQFAQSAGVALANTNFQDIPQADSYEEFFTSLGFPNAPAQAQPVPTNTDISTPDAYPNDHLDQGNSSFQSAQSAGISMANTNLQDIPDSYEQFFTSLEFPNAPAEVQQPSNIDTFTIEQFRAFFQSLDPETREYIATPPAGEASRALAGDVSDPEIEGMFDTAQPDWQATYRQQWNQTADTHMPTGNLASQSQEQWGYSAVNAQARAQMQTSMPLVPDVPFTPPNYPQEQQEEYKPSVIDYMEKSYGINIRPNDYNIFTRRQNPQSINLNKHNMNTSYGQIPGHGPEFVQGSSSEDANSFQNMYPPTFNNPSHRSKGPLLSMTPSKRKHTDDMTIKPPKPYRRRKISPESDTLEPSPWSMPPSSPASESPQPESETSSEGENLVDSFFEFRGGRRHDYSCRYIHPFSGHVCYKVVAGQCRRNRFRHLATHAQLEETQVAHGRLDIANALLFPRLRKQVVECNIGACDFRVEVWRTDHVRKNHEKECHWDVYMDRVQDKRNKRTKM